MNPAQVYARLFAAKPHERLVIALALIADVAHDEASSGADVAAVVYEQMAGLGVPVR